MTARSYFGKMNSTLGSVVPLACLGKKLLDADEDIIGITLLKGSTQQFNRFKN